jgi:hypothetical protein
MAPPTELLLRLVAAQQATLRSERGWDAVARSCANELKDEGVRRRDPNLHSCADMLAGGCSAPATERQAAVLEALRIAYQVVLDAAAR